MSTGRAGVFLDRDGTLNEEVDFVRHPEELRLLPGAGEAVRRLNGARLPVCVVSNQSGVARGYLTEEDLVPIHARLAAGIGASGGHLDRIYYCPHHPREGLPPYNVECACRKPGFGMLLRGAGELDLDLKRSFMVGDGLVDMQAGNAAGTACILVLTGYGRQSRPECAAQGLRLDCVAESITEAVDFILRRTEGET
ncbi:MAG: HAD family hydrolase [Bacteroidota bacterium]